MWSIPTPSSASAPATRSSPVIRRLVIVDLGAVGGQHVPLGAELVEALAGGVSGLAVADVVVERVSVVGHLALAAGSGDRPELGRGHSAHGGRLALGRQRRPD